MPMYIQKCYFILNYVEYIKIDFPQPSRKLLLKEKDENPFKYEELKTLK